MHILLLEPDNLLAGSIKRYFAYANHTVSVHSDPQQAVQDADQHTPNIVITDIQLAGRSGIEFLYEFRSYPDWQAIPVIIFSNLRQDVLNDFSMVFNELNVSAYLYKSSTSLKCLLEAAQQSQQLVA